MSEHYPNYLIHYGIQGQKWGQRNYQNPDGTWTEEGKRRRRIGDDRDGSSIEMTGSKTSNGSSSNTSFAKSIKEDVRAINGGKKGHAYGFNRDENCAFCSVAYELRRRGNDVRAQESLRGVQVELANKNGAFGKIIPNFSKVSKDTIDFAERATDSRKMIDIGMTRKEYTKMTETLASQGEGARGFITVDWKGGYGGHIFNYEVNGGKLYFIDAQPGTIKKADMSYYKNVLANANNIQTLRTDNIKINEDKAKKYYTEDTNTDIRINKALKNQQTATAVGGVIGAVLGLSVGVPHLGAALGVTAGASLYEKKIKDANDEASIELQNKWKNEGRFKEKWYDIKVEDIKKDSDKGNIIPKNISSRIQSLATSGLTYEEIAKRLGVSKSTINKYV